MTEFFGEFPNAYCCDCMVTFELRLAVNRICHNVNRANLMRSAPRPCCDIYLIRDWINNALKRCAPVHLRATLRIGCLYLSVGTLQLYKVEIDRIVFIWMPRVYGCETEPRVNKHLRALICGRISFFHIENSTAKRCTCINLFFSTGFPLAFFSLSLFAAFSLEQSHFDNGKAIGTRGGNRTHFWSDDVNCHHGSVVTVKWQSHYRNVDCSFSENSTGQIMIIIL